MFTSKLIKATAVAATIGGLAFGLTTTLTANEKSNVVDTNKFSSTSHDDHTVVTNDSGEKSECYRLSHRHNKMN
jgi:hypothetical protein